MLSHQNMRKMSHRLRKCTAVLLSLPLFSRLLCWHRFSMLSRPKRKLKSKDKTETDAHETSEKESFIYKCFPRKERTHSHVADLFPALIGWCYRFTTLIYLFILLKEDIALLWRINGCTWAPVSERAVHCTDFLLKSWTNQPKHIFCDQLQLPSKI